MKKLLMPLMVLLVMIFAGPVMAADVTLEWDANTETDLGGYKVYFKTDGPGPPYDGMVSDQGASPIDVGNVTEFTLTGLPALQEGERYRFVVTAYSLLTDDQGQNLESGYSNEVDGGVPTDPGNLKIVASSP